MPAPKAPTHPKAPSFLVTNAGTRLDYGTVWHEFDRIRRRSGLDRESLGRQVRMHDLRHVFVLRTLLGWYREDTDVEAQLPLLATFLGHVNPASTFWYLHAAPELLALGADRLDSTLGGLA